MRWTDRQQAMLQAMGVKPWGPLRPGPQALPAGALAEGPGPSALAEAVADALPDVPPDAQPAGPSPLRASRAGDAGIASPSGARPGSPPSPSPLTSTEARRVAPPPGQVAEPGQDYRSPGRPGEQRDAQTAAGAPEAAPPAPGLTRITAPADPVLLQSAAAAPSHPAFDADWPALREAVAACQACGLCRTRRQTVFGVGHPQAHLMIVGEAPGADEDRLGEPFVGRAGQLLDRMLAAIGLTRSEAGPAQQVFICNTLKCRPPGNRNPSPEELQRCAPFLERQLQLVQPRVLLAIGRFAAQALLGSDASIGQLRGRVHQWQGRPLVVSYHPAYLLRQPAEKAKAWEDLCRVADLLEGGPG